MGVWEVLQKYQLQAQKEKPHASGLDQTENQKDPDIRHDGELSLPPTQKEPEKSHGESNLPQAQKEPKNGLI